MKPKKRQVLICAALLLACVFLVLPDTGVKGQSETGEEEKAAAITPVASYSDPYWKEASTDYYSSLTRLKKDLDTAFKPEIFQLLTTEESAAGGIGFWPIPVRIGEKSRYFCVFAKVYVPPQSPGMPFPDTQTGRILAIMDAYGKKNISFLARELKAISDERLEGAALIFIYARQKPGSAGFEENAEALALFMKKDDVILFSELRMTLQTLFSQSEMLPIMQGSQQIENLRLYIIQP